MVEVEIRKTDLSRCHPLLRKGGGGDSKHGFSSSQMESVASICEAFIPSLPPPPPSTNGSIDGRKEKTIKDFYRMSGSDHPLPDQVSLAHPLNTCRGLSYAFIVVHFFFFRFFSIQLTDLQCSCKCRLRTLTLNFNRSRSYLREEEFQTDWSWSNSSSGH